MKALVSLKGHTQLQDIPKPLLEEGDLLLRVKACGVCFSDVHKLRYQMLDEAKVLGHEVAGKVVEIGSAVRRFNVGDRVVVAHHVPCLNCHYCNHGNISMCSQFKQTNLDPGGFAEFVRVPATHVESVTFAIPTGLPEAEASFMEPLGCCVRAVKRAGIQPSDVVVLVGLGSIGLLLLQLIRHAGATCVGIDLDADRRLFAERIGRIRCFSGAEPDFQRQLSDGTQGRGADSLLLTAGNPAFVAHALTWLRAGGTCTIFASLHPDSCVALDWNQLYYRELSITSSYSASPGDLAEALQLLEKGAVRVSDLTCNTFRFEQFADALAAIEARAILKAIMTPHD